MRSATAGRAATDAVTAVTSEGPRGSDIVDGGSDEEETRSASVETTSAATLAGRPCEAREGNMGARGVVLRSVRRLLLLLLLWRRWELLDRQAMTVEGTMEDR